MSWTTVNCRTNRRPIPIALWRAECPRCIASQYEQALGNRGLESPVLLLPTAYRLLLIEKLTCDFGCRLARLEDFFFRLIFELGVLVRGKVIFSRNDAELF